MVTTYHKLLNYDATALAKLIKDGRITSEAVVHTYIAQIKQTEGDVNAFVEERFSEALFEAQLYDAKREAGEQLGELAGVPVSVKESFDVQGLRTTGGVIERADHVSQRDADVIAKLRAAGAIIIGKTNTPALSFCHETENKLFGRTDNPWDKTKTAGGSSGGEGALLAVGGSAVGIGSGNGGSIRLPAHFNGVMGFKSGRNQVSDEGDFPPQVHPLQRRLYGVGPVGKSVRDMKLIYELMAKTKPEEHPLAHVTIDILPNHPDYNLSAETKDILNQLEFYLNEAYETNRRIPPRFEGVSGLWQEIMAIDGAKPLRELVLKGGYTELTATYMMEFITRGTNHHLYLLWSLLAAEMFKPSAKRIKQIQTEITEGDVELDHYFTNRILILPVYHTPAKAHGEVYQDVFSIQESFRTYLPFVTYANVWGLPALTIPVGTSEDGLPIGVQLLSKNGNEDLLFKLGDIIADRFRGYKRCTTYDQSS